MNEEFEQWWDTIQPALGNAYKHIAKKAYLAGAEAQKRKDIEIAESKDNGAYSNHAEYILGWNHCCCEIAEAIERGEV